MIRNIHAREQLPNVDGYRRAVRGREGGREGDDDEADEELEGMDGGREGGDQEKLNRARLLRNSCIGSHWRQCIRISAKIEKDTDTAAVVQRM